MLLIEKCIGLIHVYWSNPVWIVLDVVVVAWILDFRFVYSCWVNLVYALLHLPFRSSIVLMALLIVIVGFLFSLSLAAVCVLGGGRWSRKVLGGAYGMKWSSSGRKLQIGDLGSSERPSRGMNPLQLYFVNIIYFYFKVKGLKE